MIVTAIAAVGRNGEIGAAGRLPWPRLARDMRRFRELTWRRPVVVGRRTWESLPTLTLPGRYLIVLGRDPDAIRADLAGLTPAARATIDAAGSVDAALALAADHCRRAADAEPDLLAAVGAGVVVAGGAAVYAAFWGRIARLDLTRVDAAFPAADTFFPHYPPPAREWHERKEGRHPVVDTATGLGLYFATYDRRFFL